MIGLFGLLLPVLVVAAVVWAVRAAGRRAGGEDRPAWSLRRGLQYPFLAGVLFAAAAGLSVLLRVALPDTARLAGTVSRDVALGLSLVVVALPVWALLGHRLRRRLLRDTDERASASWLLYLLLAEVVSLAVAVEGLVRVGEWLVGVEDFPGPALARAVVWSAVWAVHAWLLRQPRLAPAHPRPELVPLVGSGIGLAGVAGGVGGAVLAAFQALYGTLVGGVLVAGGEPELVRRSLVVLAVALPVWWWHWLRDAARQGRPDRPARTVLWHGYVLLVPVLAGLLAAVGAAATGLFVALQWSVGVPDATSAAAHFDVVPGVAATFLVGGAVWLYHRAVLREAAGRSRTEPERAYEYLVAGAGLLAAAGGVTVTLTALLETLVPPIAGTDPAGRNTLVLAITLLVVGAPLWAAFWRRAQRTARGGDHEELRSPSRRTYLFLLFGAVGLTAAVSLMVTLFVVFRDLLEGGVAAATVHEVRVAVALVVTAGVVSLYHWAVYSSDRSLLPEREEQEVRTVLLVTRDTDGLAPEVAQRTGARVRVLRRLDGDGEVGTSGPGADAVVAAVLAAGSAQVLVVAGDESDLTVIPYEG